MAPLSSGELGATEPLPDGQVVDAPQRGKRGVSVRMEAYAGPLPHPDLLAKFDQVCPGGADRIITQFEEQGRHRRRIESRVVWLNVFSAIVGQVTGALLFAGTVGGGVFLIYHDKNAMGLASIVTAVAGAVTILRKAGEAREKDLARKRSTGK